MILVAVMLVFFVVLIYLYYKISVAGKVSTFNKWLLTACSIVVLTISDKIKLIAWVIVVGVVWTIKYFTNKKQNNGRTA